MTDSKFYGTTNLSTLSYLEFGAIDLLNGSKTVWDFRVNQKAYDWLMLARYANDMATYLDMIDAAKDGSIDAAIDIYRREIHHRDDFSVNLGKLIALTIASSENASPSFFELGQTLFGCIEGMEFCKVLLQKMDMSLHIPDLQRVAWYGVDISRLFNRFAVRMHPGYSVSVYEAVDELPIQPSLFFAKGVTLLYAIRSLDGLFKLLNSCDAALFDYSLSVDGTQEVTIGTGKTVRYLPLNDFMAAYGGSGKEMHVRRGNSHYGNDTGRLFIDAIWGSADYCRRYIALDTLVRGTLSSGIGRKVDAELILDKSNGKTGGWMPLEEFIKTCIPARG